MATCAYRKAQETELQEYGVPACRDCFNIVKPNLIALLAYASSWFRILLTRQVSSNLPPPPPELVAAREDMERAHRRLEDYFSRGIVPEDLKWSG